MAKHTGTRNRHLTLATFLTAVAALGVHVVAQSQAPESQPAPGNYDIRISKDAAGAAEYLERFAGASRAGEAAAGRIAGIAQLQNDGKALELIADGPLGIVEVMGAAPGSGFLTTASADRVAAMRAFMSTYPGVYGLSSDQIAGLDVVADYMNPSGSMGWVEFEQRINGLPVFQGLIRGGFTANGELARTTGLLAPGLVASTLPTAPAISAAGAVSRAATNVGWDVPESTLAQKAVEDGRVIFDRGALADDAKAWLMYFPLAPGVARLAWATEIWGDPHVFFIALDAEDGTVLFRKNLTEFQTQAATYVVYDNDSPAPLSPTNAVPGTNTQAPYIGRQTITLIGNEAPNTFNNLGWMTDNTNGVNGHTDGNNVEAGMDLGAPDGVDAPVPGTLRVFDFAYNPEVEAPSTAAYRSGEATNMFYWTNVYHDRLYLLGFNEAARNFQSDNFGRGGLGNDRVRAEGQDFSGTNNANFTTPPDGVRGRMQMYVFPGPTPDRSSGIDQDVLLHELTHGTSNRLHNNALGLISNMSRGLGEGWSDFYARSLLSTASEDVNGVYAMGGWVTNSIFGGYTDNYYYGIRRFPRAVRTTVGPNGMPHDPLTFADIDQTQINLTDGAYPRGPIGSNTADQVHNMGEVWSGALFEVRARFITRLGFAVGNERILQFVTDGMKLDPANPTFLQARDAILAAANAGGGTAADIADIWAGFAARGMGVLAKVTNPGSFDPNGFGDGSTRVFQNFNVPGDVVPGFSINDVTVAEGNAGTTSATFTVTLANPPATETRVHVGTSDGTAVSTTTFSNAAAITIPSSGNATPYPSAITVPAGLGNLQAVSVTLNGVAHTWPDDIDILLVGPGGQNVILMSDVAGFNPGVSGLTLTFRDGAPEIFGGLAPASGTYRPSNVDATEVFGAPAPGGPYGANLSVFNGTNPTGTWSLFVRDDVAGDAGQIAGGWTLRLTTAAQDYVNKSELLVFPPGTTSRPATVTINGDTVVEGDETFQVTLSDPTGAVIVDGQGLGTITNDDSSALPPTAVDDAYSTPFNTPLNVGAPGVLGNDNSNGGGVMTAAVVTNVSNGALALAANGGFTYTPNTGFSGIDSFTYRATNSSGPGNIATVTIVVGSASPPTAVNDAYSTPFQTALLVPTPGVLSNDNSNGGGAMTAQLVTNVTNGVLSLDSTGGFLYTPNPGFVGADAFVYRAVTSAGQSGNATVSLTVNEPTTVQPPTGLYVSSMFGNQITLRWDPATIGPDATSFVLEGGVNPGEVLGSLPTGPYPIISFVAPTGSFYLRVHALNGSQRSGASNEIRVFINVPQTPSAPAGLVGLANGASLTLAWRNTFAGGVPRSIVVDVSGSTSGSIPLGLVDTLTFAGVPGGTYTFSLRARNATGTSASSNAVTLTFPGSCSAAPEAPPNFLAYKIGNTLYLVWDPATTGSAPTMYVVNATGPVSGNFPTTVHSLNGVVPPGTYNLSITAQNACGSATTPTQTITIP
jgi:subtilisin-like proprotein convertase family protein